MGLLKIFLKYIFTGIYFHLGKLLRKDFKELFTKSQLKET